MKTGKILSVFCLGLSAMLSGCFGNSDNNILLTTISQIYMKGKDHVEQLANYESWERFCQGKISNFLKNLYVHCGKGIGWVQQYGN